MSDGSDADRRKWTHKRAQFDSAIHSAQLLGFVHRLASGDLQHRAVIEILRQVNASSDQSRYVTETLAIKKDLRDLARQDYHPEISAFLTGAAGLIPELSDGLASQIMMVLGHAGQNDAYLEIVSDAVSTLLADLDHPLSTDARKYLRLLWDQMEATRKLKNTEAAIAGPPFPPASRPTPSDERDSGKFAQTRAQYVERRSSQPVRAEPVHDVRPPESFDHWALVARPEGVAPRPSPKSVEPIRGTTPTSVEPPKADSTSHRVADVDPTTDVAGAPSDLAATSSNIPSSIPKARIQSIAAPEAADDFESLQPPGEITPSPVVVGPQSEAPTGSATRPMPATVTASDKHLIEHEVTLVQFAVSPSARPAEPILEPSRAVRTAADQPRDVLDGHVGKVPSVPPSDVLEQGWDDKPVNGRVPNDDADLKIPTRSVPRWALLTAVAAVGVLVAAVVYFTRSESSSTEQPPPGNTAKLPTSVATHAAPAPVRAAPAQPEPKVTTEPPPPAPPPTPVEPPPAPAAQPKSASEPHANASPKPHSARIAVDALHVPAVPPPKNLPAPAASGKPAPASSAAAEPKHAATAVVTPPDVAKNLNPLDRIIAELRIISPDPAGIEDKARELSRIIANAKRKDAFYIIDHLGPPVALDPLGRDPVLEESLRVFAISTLGRVATDDDDTRAVSAIYMLGEWAKSGGKGRQKAIAAIESLSKENVVRSSAPRAKALRAAKAEIND